MTGFTERSLGERRAAAGPTGRRRGVFRFGPVAARRTRSSAKCLIVGTPADRLVDAERAKEASGLSAEDVARVERKTQALEKDLRAIEETYGRNVLDLVVVAGYVRKLLESARAVRFLSGNYPEILAEFQKLAESRSLADAAEVA